MGEVLNLFRRAGFGQGVADNLELGGGGGGVAVEGVGDVFRECLPRRDRPGPRA
ncbi:MAG: hypothetical protein HQ494_15290 [Rhodospirillales bacterium]|nr:hypothetical protein [Rhodospirillales bacterium]